MRKNYTYTAKVSSDRNEFIKMIEAEEEAVVVDNNLLQEISKEVNKNLSDKKTSGFFKKLAVPMSLMMWNPVGWTFGGIVWLCGAFLGSFNDLKKYVTYEGVDTAGKQILILHHKHKVDLKYDKVIYPDLVKGVSNKKAKKVHTK